MADLGGGGVRWVRSNPLLCLEFTLKAQEMVSLMLQISKFSGPHAPGSPYFVTPLACTNSNPPSQNPGSTTAIHTHTIIQHHRVFCHCCIFRLQRFIQLEARGIFLHCHLEPLHSEFTIRREILKLQITQKVCPKTKLMHHSTKILRYHLSSTFKILSDLCKPNNKLYQILQDTR